MKKNIMRHFSLVFFVFVFTGVILYSVSADDVEIIYIDECGACHFAYPPELLPETSWEKVLSGLDKHFGEEIILLRERESVIEHYLKSRAAENSSKRHAIKIMGSLGRRSPIRITDIPYIRKEHKEISSDIFNREAVGSFSNCAACHLEAEDGIFSKDDAEIPE